MTAIALKAPAAAPQRDLTDWLKRYYAVRALVSVLWIALAVTVGRAQPAIGAALFVAYPLWDCVANSIDARRNGGLRANPTQVLNAAISLVVAIAVGIALTHDIFAASAVIGIWAGLSGFLQLATGVRRWRKASAQWPQILSGAQSCLGATFIVKSALHPVAGTTVASIAPYVGFGALYFAISAIVLMLKRR